jgi:Tol biopolymer transport system component
MDTGAVNALRLVALVGLAAVLAAVLAAALAAGDGGAATPRPRANVSMFFPAWSRDGHWIAWTQPTAGGGARIWVAHPDGAGAHPIARPTRGLGQIAWVSHDRLLVWVGFRLVAVTLSGRGTVVARVNGERFSLDRAGVHVATGPPGCALCTGPVEVQDLVTGGTVDVGPAGDRADEPSLAPDGRSVAFQRARCDRAGDACSPLGGIWVAAARPHAPLRELTRTGTCPTWAPDASRIAYLAGNALRVAAVATGSTRLLDGDASCGQATNPAWSPDGRRLAVVGRSQARLALVDARTGRVRRVGTPGLGVVVGLAWAPGGRQLLVAARPVPYACSSLWRVDAATAAATLVRPC